MEFNCTYKIILSVQKFFNKHNVENQRLLIATSGGIDSIVVVDICKKLGLDFSIAHCNFNLRGSESEGDEKFVENLARKYGVNFFLKNFYPQNFPQHSTQMLARKLRYEWFYEIAKAEKYDFIITAHHLNDVIETCFQNICRGTGILGLTNFYESSIKGILRPLVRIKKDEIINYAHENFLKWREDSSNKKNIYKRNFIRNEIIPRLKNLNSSLEETFLRNLDRWSGEHELMKLKLKELEEIYVQKTLNKTIIQVSNIKSEGFFKIFIYNILKEYGFSYETISQFIVNGAELNAKLVSQTHLLVVERDFWEVTRLSDKRKNADDNFLITFTLPTKIGEPKIISLLDGTTLQISLKKATHKIKSNKNEHIAFFAKEKLKNELSIRFWEYGDTFIPLGMKGKKKISDFFNDLKISVSQRKSSLVMLSNSEVAWLVGYRISEKFKVEKASEEVYRFEISKEIY